MVVVMNRQGQKRKYRDAKITGNETFCFGIHTSSASLDEKEISRHSEFHSIGHGPRAPSSSAIFIVFRCFVFRFVDGETDHEAHSSSIASCLRPLEQLLLLLLLTTTNTLTSNKHNEYKYRQ
jgi:hypothetical protein